MDSHDSSNGFSRQYTQRPGMSLTAQLMKAAESLHSIDDMFLWLANAIVRGFDVQVVQVWAVQAYHTGKSVLELRTLVCQDVSLPQQVVVNNHVVAVAETILREQRNSLLSPVDQIFSQHHLVLLNRYGLRYCTGAAFLSQGQLPPARNDAVRIPTPVAIATFLFLHNPVHSELLGGIDQVFRQALQFGLARGLLIPPANAAYSLQAQQRQTGPLPSPPVPLDGLVPRRCEDANLLSTTNPLTSANPIQDKQARRLYSAIDGHKNVGDLGIVTRLSQAEVYKALQVLLTQRRIQLYGPEGQLVASSQVFPTL